MKPHSRSGVSLIEFLVVMAIIAVLAAASLSVLGLTGTSGRVAQTGTAIQAVSSVLNTRRNEFNDNLVSQQQKGATDTTWLNVKLNAQLVAGTAPAAAKQALIVLDRYRGTFPQREEDMYGLDGVAGNADDSPLLAMWRAKNPSTKPDRTLESSELLMLAITVGQSGGRGKEILDKVHRSLLVDKDGPDTNGDGVRDPNGIPELYDGWGNPVRFYNAPTRLIRPGGPDTAPSAVTHALATELISGLPAFPPTLSAARDFTDTFNQNPLDPRGALRVMPIPAAPAAVGRFFDSPIALEDRFQTPDTWFQPILVSCGPDEALGLGEPTASGPARLAQVVSADEAADNVTSGQSTK